MSVRRTIGRTIGATAAAVCHLGWWLEWHSRSSPTGGGRPAD